MPDLIWIVSLIDHLESLLKACVYYTPLLCTCTYRSVPGRHPWTLYYNNTNIISPVFEHTQIERISITLLPYILDGQLLL